jgi:hypothetical protein
MQGVFTQTSAEANSTSNDSFKSQHHLEVSAKKHQKLHKNYFRNYSFSQVQHNCKPICTTSPDSMLHQTCHAIVFKQISKCFIQMPCSNAKFCKHCIQLH